MSSPPTLLVEDDSEAGQILLASVAHELRTPLATLVNAAAFLRDVVADNPDGVAALEMIQRQARVLTRLVSDLVDTTRMDRGQLSATFEVIDLREVLRWAQSTCEPALKARAHTLQALSSDDRLPVVGDRDRLVQVFVNLLDNAIKYTPRGGTISLIATAEGGAAVVRARDTGVGMSASTLPHVFELFRQARSTKSMANGGLGIGLALVRRIVAMHGGTVLARSEGRGKGSEFTVRLPLDAQSFSAVLSTGRCAHGSMLATVRPVSG